MNPIASYIDHTILKPTTTKEEVAQLCKEAQQHQFAAVCVPPIYVAQARQALASSAVRVATVIGFPMGYSSIASKVTEVRQTIIEGADELDVVINLTALHNNDFTYLSKEIVACLQPIRLYRKNIKVIIESGILSDEQIIRCCDLYAQHKVDFVKTSTGYAEKGASLHAVQLMRKLLPAEVAIKASGGIRTFDIAQELIAAGASRIGTSSGVQIIGE